jgi:hypothetical protein
MQPDNSHDTADAEKRGDPRGGRRADDEVGVERTAIVADAVRGESEGLPPSIERRRLERRRIDRMSTGI